MSFCRFVGDMAFCPTQEKKKYIKGKFIPFRPSTFNPTRWPNSKMRWLFFVIYIVGFGWLKASKMHANLVFFSVVVVWVCECVSVCRLTMRKSMLARYQLEKWVLEFTKCQIWIYSGDLGRMTIPVIGENSSSRRKNIYTSLAIFILTVHLIVNGPRTGFQCIFSNIQKVHMREYFLNIIFEWWEEEEEVRRNSIMSATIKFITARDIHFPKTLPYCFKLLELHCIYKQN